MMYNVKPLNHEATKYFSGEGAGTLVK